MNNTIHNQNCERFEDSYDFYVLGSLEEPEASAFSEHLLAGCAYCEAQLQRASNRAQFISQTVPLAEPPTRLRSRFAGSIGAAPVAGRNNLLPWLIAIAASLILAVLSLRQFQAQHSVEQPAQTLTAESARVSNMLQILAAPGTVELPLTDAKRQTLHGTLYVHKKLGMAMVVDTLPAPPSGWVYQSWVTPRNGAPRPIELFATDPQGRAVTVFRGPVEVAQFSSMLISMEPVGSVPSKPTTLVFEGEMKKAG